MATLAILAGGMMMAFGIAWVGVQGLRGIPDSNGKKTTKGTAVGALVLAFLILVGTLMIPFFLSGE
jgi:hypothetical protein